MLPNCHSVLKAIKVPFLLEKLPFSFRKKILVEDHLNGSMQVIYQRVLVTIPTPPSSPCLTMLYKFLFSFPFVLYGKGKDENYNIPEFLSKYVINTFKLFYNLLAQLGKKIPF